MKPLVSIIISTKNAERTLRACLDSIAEQNYDNLETILVDNYSTDSTCTIARECNWTVITQGGERCKQRNVGFEHATGDYFLYLDADMILEPTVVSACVQKIEATECDAIVIHEESFGEGFWAQCKILERSSYKDDDLIEAARFMRRDVFERAGGFDERLVAAEDWQLHQKIVGLGSYIEQIEPIIRHDEGRLNILGLWKKKLYYASHLPAFVNVQKEKKGLLFLLRRFYLFRGSLWRNWKAFALHPIQTCGMVIMLTGESVCAGIGYLKGTGS